LYTAFYAQGKFLETRQQVLDAEKVQGGQVVKDIEGCLHTYLGSGLRVHGAVHIIYRKTTDVANIF
jgi:hypothetical protein